MSLKKKQSLKKILILSTIGLIAFVIIIYFVTKNSKLTRDDYKQAYATTNKIIVLGNDAFAKVNINDNDIDIDKELETKIEKINQIDEELEELGELKVIKKDEKANKYYKRISQKKKVFLSLKKDSMLISRKTLDTNKTCSLLEETIINKKVVKDSIYKNCLSSIKKINTKGLKQKNSKNWIKLYKKNSTLLAENMFNLSKDFKNTQLNREYNELYNSLLKNQQIYSEKEKQLIIKHNFMNELTELNEYMSNSKDIFKKK